MKKTIKFSFVIQFVIIFSLIIIYIFQWAIMISNPALRAGTDFSAFYAGGVVAQTHGFSNAYKIELQQSVQEELAEFPLVEGQVLLYNHVPYLLPILSLLASENYIASFVRWAFLMLAAYTAGILIFLRNTRIGFDHLIFVGALLFFPFFQSILLGQDTALLFLGMALWCAGMEKRKDWLAAIGLSLTTVRPHLCLALAIPLLFNHRSVAWRFILAAGVLTLFSMILIGKEGVSDFVRILQISAGGTWYGMKESAMFNLIGLLSRTFPVIKHEMLRALGWVGYGIGILLATMVWNRRETTLLAKIGVNIILALFFAPHLHYHDLTLLTIPLVFLSQPGRFASQIPLAISFSLLILKPLYYVLPYVLYTALIWGLVKGKNKAQGQNAGVPVK